MLLNLKDCSEPSLVVHIFWNYVRLIFFRESYKLFSLQNEIVQILLATENHRLSEIVIGCRILQRTKIYRSRFSEEFKRESVELFQGSGVSAEQVSAELGISTSLLYRWVCDSRDDPLEADRPSYKELEKELRRTRRELDFLKKALSYFTSPVRMVSIPRPVASALSRGINVPDVACTAEQVLRLATTRSAVAKDVYRSPFIGC